MSENWFTPVKAPETAARLRSGAGITSLGSCFAERLAEYLTAGGAAVRGNPCGIVYNAVSMARSMRHLALGREYREEDFFERDGWWFSWEHHGSFARRDAAEAAACCNAAMREFRAALETAELMILTFSSSVVYEHCASGAVVANCHKMPGTLFRKRILSCAENRAAIRSLLRSVRRVRPGLRVVMTLSPVRHYPGDLVLNARSKANLLAAIHECTDDERNLYFPAYEIMNDELRDYRFYGDDMLHLSERAAELICRRFVEHWFTPEALARIDEQRRLARQAAHRPIHGSGDA
jgi:hypothetical protein